MVPESLLNVELSTMLVLLAVCLALFGVAHGLFMRHGRRRYRLAMHGAVLSAVVLIAESILALALLILGRASARAAHVIGAGILLVLAALSVCLVLITGLAWHVEDEMRAD